MRRARVSSGVGLLAALGVVVAAAVTVRAVDDKDKVAPGRRADQEGLKAHAPLVGSWRGVGQVQRGQVRGAWTESADWAWKLTSDSAGLEITVKKGKTYWVCCSGCRDLFNDDPESVLTEAAARVKGKAKK